MLFAFLHHSIRAKLLFGQRHGSRTTSIINSFRDSNKKTQTQIHGCKYRRASTKPKSKYIHSKSLLYWFLPAYTPRTHTHTHILGYLWSLWRHINLHSRVRTNFWQRHVACVTNHTQHKHLCGTHICMHAPLA